MGGREGVGVIVCEKTQDCRKHSYLIPDIFVLVTFAEAKVEVIRFDTLVAGHQRLASLHVLRIN